MSEGSQTQLKYKRILLKVSGESLGGSNRFGVDPQALRHMVTEISQVANCGVEVGVVIGGGNLFRGITLESSGLERVVGDHIGMLATVMNALVLQQTLAKEGLSTALFSAMGIPGIAELYHRKLALNCLAEGKIVLFAGGTGNPLFTTDSAACLRAIEMRADLVLKGTRVDGIYTANPEEDDSAELIPRTSYNEILAKKLAVMDLTAICLCQEHDMPLCVFNIEVAGRLMKIIRGENCGTLVDS